LHLEAPRSDRIRQAFIHRDNLIDRFSWLDRLRLLAYGGGQARQAARIVLIGVDSCDQRRIIGL